MDTRDGKIYWSNGEDVLDLQGLKERCYWRKDNEELTSDDLNYLHEMGYHPTPLQRVRGTVARNDLCPCCSGKKFKKCCIGKSND